MVLASAIDFMNGFEISNRGTKRPVLRLILRIKKLPRTIIDDIALVLTNNNIDKVWTYNWSKFSLNFALVVKRQSSEFGATLSITSPVRLNCIDLILKKHKIWISLIDNIWIFWPVIFYPSLIDNDFLDSSVLEPLEHTPATRPTKNEKQNLH